MASESPTGGKSTLRAFVLTLAILVLGATPALAQAQAKPQAPGNAPHPPAQDSSLAHDKQVVQDRWGAPTGNETPPTKATKKDKSANNGPQKAPETPK
jgi:hypothetical protein